MLDIVALILIGMFFPIVTVLTKILSKDESEKFLKFPIAIMITLIMFISLYFLMFFYKMQGSFKYLIKNTVGEYYTIPIQAGIIVFIVLFILYAVWFTTNKKRIAENCWEWIRFLSVLIISWYILPFFFLIIFLGVDLLFFLEVSIGAPAIGIAIYKIFYNLPKPIKNKGNVFGKLLPFIIVINIINSAVLWYFIIIGGTPYTLISFTIMSVVGWLAWIVGSTKS